MINLYIFETTDLILLTLIVILFVFDLFLLFYLLGFKKRIKLLFKGKKTKDLEEVILEQIKRVENQAKEIKKLNNKISELEKISKISFQKLGIVRFNPFEDVGGDQSFVIALLDREDNGFVISSLYTREGNRIYSKPIENGKSKYSLSEEEEKALSEAKKS